MEMIEKEKFKLHKISMRGKLLMFVVFLLFVVLSFATYAWFSASLNVKVKFFDVKVSTETGLFISLDGVNFSDSVEISRDSITKDLVHTYPNHTNQWAATGLWSVSSNGIPNSNSSKFAIYNGSMGKYTDKARKGKRFINTTLLEENHSSEWNQYIAFDIFLKNVSGSPLKDNLYIGRSTFIDFDETADDETREKMQDILNTMRMGIVKIGETSSKSDVSTIQNLQCDGQCSSLIYEPNSTKHNKESIDAAALLDISISDGVYVPTYGVIAEGSKLDHKSGFINSGVDLDTEHFALQHTIFESDFSNPIFKIPNGITKLRVYVWIEGQDVDALEVHSEGAPVALNLDFEKDLAGYEEY
jgi:hypothetical protein